MGDGARGTLGLKGSELACWRLTGVKGGEISCSASFLT